MDSNGHKVIVVDNGTGFVKCGYAGSNFPAHIFPSMLGRPTVRSTSKIGDIEIKVFTFFIHFLDHYVFLFTAFFSFIQ
ncbi:unnamed protein product [Soboliphyme baturini]|uniref:ACTR2 n=1 Tax=Soboliphyme baturini TaxID=241478 RepID=A0A183JAA8_9BILA|nr:unnamed protein product [Soboliphyme baturini]